MLTPDFKEIILVAVVFEKCKFEKNDWIGQLLLVRLINQDPISFSNSHVVVLKRFVFSLKNGLGKIKNQIINRTHPKDESFFIL